MRNAGDLRARAVLYKRVPVVAGGRSLDSWEKIGECAAEILHASARMFYQAAQWTETTVLIHIRTPRSFVPGAGLRVVCRGIGYDVIESVPDKPMRGFTELRAQQVEMEGSGICGM